MSALDAALDALGTPRIWALIVVIGVATFLLRFSFIFLFGRVEEVPPRVRTALRFVPPAVFAALAVPAVVSIDGSLGATVTDDRFLAGTLAAVVAWRTESMAWTLAAGMGTLWLLLAL
mgnify:CR=1 FL=1